MLGSRKCYCKALVVGLWLLNVVVVEVCWGCVCYSGVWLVTCLFLHLPLVYNLLRPTHCNGNTTLNVKNLLGQIYQPIKCRIALQCGILINRPVVCYYLNLTIIWKTYVSAHVNMIFHRCLRGIQTDQWLIEWYIRKDKPDIRCRVSTFLPSICCQKNFSTEGRKIWWVKKSFLTKSKNKTEEEVLDSFFRINTFLHTLTCLKRYYKRTPSLWCVYRLLVLGESLVWLCRRWDICLPKLEISNPYFSFYPLLYITAVPNMIIMMMTDESTLQLIMIMISVRESSLILAQACKLPTTLTATLTAYHHADYRAELSRTHQSTHCVFVIVFNHHSITKKEKK